MLAWLTLYNSLLKEMTIQILSMEKISFLLQKPILPSSFPLPFYSTLTQLISILMLTFCMYKYF